MSDKKDMQSLKESVKDSYVCKTSEYILPSEAINAGVPLGATFDQSFNI